MAITVVTQNPQSLVSAIKAAIDSGNITTWKYDSDGDFTHTTPDKQWEDNAWFRPNTASGSLKFGLIGPTNVVMTKVLYGVYHGRFIEMLLTHFDTRFSSAQATAMNEQPDNFKTS